MLVNPKLVMLTREVEEDWEGCLSVPGMRGVVPRYKKLRYTGFDEEGNPIDRVAEGFHARVVQHECDHLDGILYPQRMTDMSRFGFTAELFPERRSQMTEIDGSTGRPTDTKVAHILYLMHGLAPVHLLAARASPRSSSA